MDFRCEDLADHGVVLVAPGAPEYDGLRADILRRLANPIAGSPPPLGRTRRDADEETAAVLVNRAPVGIASIYQVWTFEEAGGRTYTSSIGNGINPSVLLPFGVEDRLLRLYGYWHVTLPGSKRLITSAGEIRGDNSDVRPPAEDELWKGGIIGGFGGGGRERGPLARVTLTLDGVFFTDGGFAGPNRGGLWEQTVFSAEAYVEAAKIARRLHDAGTPADRMFAEIHAALGSPADERMSPPPRLGAWTADRIRQWTRALLWGRIAMTRQHGGDERAVYMVLGWQDAAVPRFRKL